MKRLLTALAVAASLTPLMLYGQTPSAAPSQSPFWQTVPSPDGEAADFTHAVQQSTGGSAIDFIRAFEEFLEKHPESSRREQIVRGLFRASKDRKDQSRIALYGEELLKKDPDDVSLLEPVGEALNSMDDPKAAARALELGQRLEHDLAEHPSAGVPGETAHEKGKRVFDRAKSVSAAYIIQADAFGTLGKLDQAIAIAEKGFDAFSSSEAARCLGRWSAKEGRYDEAVLAYADAFAIGDTPENHRDDRAKMSELYRKSHSDEKGLGDIVLAAYDRMTALNDKRMEAFGNTPATKPIDFQLASLEGNRLPLLSLKGKVIVIDFWATWCNPCRVQHPLFEQVKDKYKDNNSVIFIEVDSGESKDTVSRFMDKYAWKGSVYLDDGLAQALKIENLPTTVLLGRNGELFSLTSGFLPSSFVDTLSAKIEDALKAPANLQTARAQGN